MTPEADAAPERAMLSASPPDETTGFPGLRTWRSVYLTVVVVFVVYVALMVALSRVFA